MKVSELIEQLSKQNQDLEVYIDTASTPGIECDNANVVWVKEMFNKDGVKFETVFITTN